MDDLFQELYDYIEPFNARWKKHLKPAPKQLINKFIRLSRVKEYADRIPLSYFQFLEKMGLDDGGLISYLHGGGTINPRDLMDEMKHCWHFRYEKDLLPRKRFPFFMDWIAGVPIYFDLSTEDNKGVWIDSGGKVERFSESFEKLLFQCAFDQYVKYKTVIFRSGNECSYEDEAKLQNIGRRGLYQKEIRIAESYGIKEVWFSEPDYYIGEGENIAFSIEYPSGCKKITSDDDRATCLDQEYFIDYMNSIKNIRVLKK